MISGTRLVFAVPFYMCEKFKKCIAKLSTESPITKNNLIILLHTLATYRFDIMLAIQKE